MIKTSKLILVLTVIIFIHFFCKSSPENITTKHYKGFSIKAHFIDSEKIDGLAKYFDIDGNLIAIINYKNGIKTGPAVNFFLNGFKKDSMTYDSGQEQGFIFHYDSSGRLGSKVNYYKGSKVGPGIIYSFGKLKQYYFNDFDSNTVFISNYDSLGRSVVGMINLDPKSMVFDEDNGESTMQLRLYLPNPPNIISIYHLGLANENNSEKKEILINNDRFYLDTILNPPPKGYHYYVSTHFQNSDSTINKLIIYKIVW